MVMTQFIFKRRDIQEWLYTFCETISLPQGQHLANRLNRHDRLEAMWEVAFLKSICKEPNFKHEEKLSNGKEPDFCISVNDGEETFSLYGDITTLSDEGIDKKNPVEFFAQELFRLREKAGLHDMVLDWRVHDKKIGDGVRARRKLKLPPKGNIPKVIKDAVMPVLREWHTRKAGVESVEIEHAKLSMTLTHRPDRRYSSSSNAGYQSVSVAEHSPLFKKLKDKKDQLGGIPEHAINVLIICDGDSHILKPMFDRGPFALDAENVCHAFLEKNSSIDTIILVAIETLQPQPFAIQKFDKRIAAKMIVQRKGKRREALTDSKIESVRELAAKWVAALPQPLMSPDNAKRRLKNNQNPTARGGFHMSENTVQISSRRVCELLAGICSPEEWKHDFDGTGPDPTNFFINKIFSNQMITNVEVKAMDSQDDDWLVIRFGDPDAAVAPFKSKPAD